MLETLGARGPYRMASLLLLAAVLLIPITGALLGAPPWVGGLPALAAYIFLVVLTHYRLRNTGWSVGWVLLMMIVVFNVGPAWHGPGTIVLYLGNLIHLVPVLIGWIAPEAAAADDPAAGRERLST